MTMLRISQLAERTGFPATTLRYYETLGLLGPVARQANGYRAYGPDAIARLQFVDRAKRLGVPLEEIAELVEVWSGGECPPCSHGCTTWCRPGRSKSRNSSGS